jgi:D-glycero-D-manno-heptose 1,7-bisphosphate phosphatase
MAMKTAVFLDRDGTLLEESGYADRLERLVFFPFSIDAVRLLNRAGHAVVIASNQSGVARGIFREEFVEEAHRHISERVAAGGARIDAFYHCPHHPEGIVETYRRTCDCRKPQPGMLIRAASDLGLSVTDSFVVGDSWHDLEAGQRVGARSILVRTGHGRMEERSPRAGIRPAAIVENLMEAVSWILRAS